MCVFLSRYMQGCSTLCHEIKKVLLTHCQAVKCPVSIPDLPLVTINFFILLFKLCR